MLDEGDAIPSMLILCSNEERCTLASDEDIPYGMHQHTILYEDRDGAVITCFTDAHEGLGEVWKEVGIRGRGMKVVKKVVGGHCLWCHWQHQRI